MHVPLKVVYNCVVSVLESNITELEKLNRTELVSMLGNVLTHSLERDTLRTKISDCIFSYQERPFDLPWWQKLCWCLVFAVILLIATGGNMIVIWIVLAHREMRTVMNYLLVNLSVADLMMSLMNCVFNFIFLLNSNWPFGKVYCTINNFVAHVTVAASVLTLVVISLDRYMAIMHPLKRRISQRKMVLTVILVWLFSCALAVPSLIYSTTSTRRYLYGKTRISCYLSWPDGGYLQSRMEYLYNHVFLGVTYLMPMTMMGICYTLIGCKLWDAKSIGEMTRYQKNAIESKRKVVKMFIVIITIFAVCWLPYQGFFIFAYHYSNVMGESYIHHVYLSFYWLAMSNAMVNPIVYYWMNSRFRWYFRILLRKFCCKIDRPDAENCHRRELQEPHRSDIARSHSARRKLSSRPRQNTTESRV